MVETATVTGPVDGHVHTDELGRVLVRFHWDRRPQPLERTSCWVRTVQPWAGPHWGHQHIPRVGAEVAVSFLGGDPDRPVVLGELRNAARPPPFSLPEHKTRSGWRTQSVPGGGGYHELSFEDACGHEQVFLRSQGALDEQVNTDHDTRVGGDRRSRVAGALTANVGKNAAVSLEGDVETVIAGRHASRVEGDADAVVRGHEQRLVQGNARRLVGGRLSTEIKEEADVSLGADSIVRSAGCLTTLIGRRDAERSLSVHAAGVVAVHGSRALELRSDEEIVLSVGKSSICIGPDEIVLHAQRIRLDSEGATLVADEGMALAAAAGVSLSGGQVVLASAGGASLGLTSEASLDGALVLLNSPAEAEDPPTRPAPTSTQIVLRDPVGAPIAHRPFVIELEDGGRRSGRLDSDGRAELRLEAVAHIAFPDVWFEGSASVVERGLRRHVVQPGEDIETLGCLYGVAPELLWDHPLNEGIAALREDANVLAPDDIVVVPIVEPYRQLLLPDTQNEYVGSVTAEPVEVVLTADGTPLSNHPCVVWGLGDPREMRTDGEGKLRFEDATVAVITVEPTGYEAIVFHLGDLDPINTVRGVQGRLQALGYLLAPPSGVIDSATTVAIERFRRDHGLAADGPIDDALRQALTEQHDR